MARKQDIEHQDNRAEDGFPLGLTKPVGQLTPQEIEAFGRRHNVWTRGKMARFLDALAASGSVKQAAASVGMSRQSAYRLRARFSGQPFDIAWDVALEFGLQQLAHAALDRALNGVEEPIFHQGEQVGTRTRYDERLTMFLLANPARVGRHPLVRERLLESWEGLLDHMKSGALELDDIRDQFDSMDQTEEGRASHAALRDDDERQARQFYAERSDYARRQREEERRAPARPPR